MSLKIISISWNQNQISTCISGHSILLLTSKNCMYTTLVQWLACINPWAKMQEFCFQISCKYHARKLYSKKLKVHLFSDSNILDCVRMCFIANIPYKFRNQEKIKENYWKISWKLINGPLLFWTQEYFMSLNTYSISKLSTNFSSFIRLQFIFIHDIDSKSLKSRKYSLTIWLMFQSWLQKITIWLMFQPWLQKMQSKWLIFQSWLQIIRRKSQVVQLD